NQAIAEWRRELAAGGVKSSSVLDELENHLREDIEQQTRLGSSEPSAFEAAVQRIGEAPSLKSEFVKTTPVFGFLGRRKSTGTHHILGVLWLIGCSWSLANLSRWFLARNLVLESLDPWLLLLSLLVGLIYIIGIVGSVSLFLGENFGRRIVRV